MGKILSAPQCLANRPFALIRSERESYRVGSAVPSSRRNASQRPAVPSGSATRCNDTASAMRRAASEKKPSGPGSAYDLGLVTADRHQRDQQRDHRDDSGTHDENRG